MPLREIGARAVEMLSRQIEADEVMAEHQVLNTHLRLRESTATLPRQL
jgi:DNA-binding LacI/PurR family transcriptional regulator